MKLDPNIRNSFYCLFYTLVSTTCEYLLGIRYLSLIPRRIFQVKHTSAVWLRLDQSARMQLLQERLLNKSPCPIYVSNYFEVSLGYPEGNQVALWAIKELFLIVQYNFYSDTRMRCLGTLSPAAQGLGQYTCRRNQLLPLVRWECYGVLFNPFVYFIFIY